MCVLVSATTDPFLALPGADRANDLDGLNAALESGLASAPEPRDSERSVRNANRLGT